MDKKECLFELFSILERMLIDEGEECSGLITEKIQKKWTLGREYKSLSDGDSAHISEIKKEDIENELINILKITKSELTQEGLSILYKDIIELIDSSCIDLNKKDQLKDILLRFWGDDIYNIEEIIKKVFKGENGILNSMFALGFLFYATVKIDGNIDREELLQIKRNLEVWDNQNAMIILEAVNYAEFIKSKGTLTEILETTSGLSTDEYKLLEDCIKYLRLHESVEVRKIMYKQIISIIKADSRITEEEKSLWKNLKEIWEDIEE